LLYFKNVAKFTRLIVSARIKWKEHIYSAIFRDEISLYIRYVFVYELFH
jgi:hypothetical protein